MKIIATKGIILARVSTEEQLNEKEGHYSIPAQLRNMRRYAKESKIEVSKEHEFQFAESGFRGKRDKFAKVLKEAMKIVEEENQPIAFIFDEVTRFTRRWKEVQKIDELRKEGKLEIHFASQNLVIHKNSKAYEVIQWEQFIGFAKATSMYMSEAVKRTYGYKLSQKQRPGYVPTGYLNDTETKTIIPDPERAPLIKEAFELYASGDYSVQELTKIMRSNGLTTKPKKGLKPKPISAGGLLWILNNPFYYGKFLWKSPESGEQELYQGDYEAIVDKETFDKVQSILNEKAIRFSTRHSAKKFFKFRGLIKCGFCDCVLTPHDQSSNYKDKKPGEEIYYRCTYSKKKVDPRWYEKKFGQKNCIQKYWREEDIEKEIVKRLAILHYDKKVFQQLRKSLNEEFQSTET
jgi:DNA invertase Pin-like site-specific DNA recombinase